MNYCIYTICTKNFKDAYDFAIESWLVNTSASKIYVYSDCSWEADDSRVEIIPLFDRCEDWLKAVSYKVTASKDVIKKPFENFV